MHVGKLYPFYSNDARSDDVRRWFGIGRFNIARRPQDATRIVVAGGDGTMLYAIKKHFRSEVTFLGIDRGTRGFLLNPIPTAEELEKLLLLDKFTVVQLRLQKVTFINRNGKARQFFAFNDTYLNADSGTEVCGTIEGEFYPKHEFRGDGIIVATAQGSTAYNQNAGGAVLPLESFDFALRTICSSRQVRSIRAMVKPQKIEIDITRGKAIGHADTKKSEVVDVVKTIIEPSNFIVRLEFIPGNDFEAKRYE